MLHRKTQHKFIALLLIAVLITSFSAGCSQKPDSQEKETPTGAESAPVSTPGNTPLSTVPMPVTAAINLGFEPNFGIAGTDYTPVSVTPVLADYTVAADLSNVANLDQFPNLTAAQRSKLADNGFVVIPGKQEQLFYIYEENTYKKIPNFVTTDSVLQVYHIFYDYALRSAEAATLLPNLAALNSNMLKQLLTEYNAITDTAVKKEALAMLGYFGVAQLSLGEALPDGFPEELMPVVEAEIALVNAAGGRTESPLFGFELDYSLFTVRGHYTRSDELGLYFKCMSWYGVVPVPLSEAEDLQSAMRAIIMTTALCRLPNENGGALWENIYSTTSFFVGEADDVTPFQLAEIIIRIYGDIPDLNELSDTVKLGSFYAELKTLEGPQINAKTGDGNAIPAGLQLRFMGQRYIPDSEILQELCEVIARPFPTGLDVFATLGSERAEELIETYFNPSAAWPKYTEEFNRMKDKFTKLPSETWRSNMYYSWLWTQTSLTGEYGAGYPMFMQNAAWQDKSLATALGSWSEMRHDTILYAKGSAAECGGFDEPPVVKAYVEPNAELYNRLLWLTSYMRENLAARDMLPQNIEYVCESFENMLGFLRDCSDKQLRGEELTAQEYDSLFTYGGLLESLTTSSIEDGVKWYQIESETDRNMAVIADVHTVLGTYLEEAVGYAAEIYVVVPIGSELYITRGAVFDYFEFVSDARLTDEQWQAMLKNDLAPARPEFTESFMEGESSEVPAPVEPYTTGC